MARRKSKIQRRFRLHALSIHPFCGWCQRPLTEDSATTDHVVPLSRGGSNNWDNLCLACVDCNQARQNNLPGEWPILVQPKAVETEPRIWVAWTRYPGGRWRRTFRGACPDSVLQRAQCLLRGTGETVILHDSEEPSQTLWTVPRSTGGEVS